MEDESTRKNSWYTFVIQVDQRDEFRAKSARCAIETAIHYPISIHLQPAANRLGYHEGDFPCAEHQGRRIITLPIHQFLDEADVNNISGAINDFFASNAYRN